MLYNRTFEFQEQLTATSTGFTFTEDITFAIGVLCLRSSANIYYSNYHITSLTSDTGSFEKVGYISQWTSEGRQVYIISLNNIKANDVLNMNGLYFGDSSGSHLLLIY